MPASDNAKKPNKESDWIEMEPIGSRIADGLVLGVAIALCGMLILWLSLTLIGW